MRFGHVVTLPGKPYFLIPDQIQNTDTVHKGVSSLLGKSSHTGSNSVSTMNETTFPLLNFENLQRWMSFMSNDFFCVTF